MARGSITPVPRRDGSRAYRVRVELPAVDGKRRWRSETHPTRKAAERALTRLLADPVAAAAATPLAEYLTDRWLPHYQTVYRASSYRQREMQVRRWLTPHLGAIPLGRLDAAALERGYAAMREAGASPSLLREIHACLGAALNQAVRWGLLPDTPARRVQLPRPETPERAIWSPAQAARLLAGPEDRYGVLWRLLAWTGLRLGEALALRWRDLALADGYLRVRQTVTRTKGGDVIGPPKSAAGRREVVIGPELVATLRRWRVTWAAERWAVGVPVDEDAYVLGWPDGAFLGFGHVYPAWERAIAAADVPPGRIHDLRHLATSVQLAAGVPLKTVAARLGHASIAVTANIYGHVRREDQAPAAALLEGAFSLERDRDVTALRSEGEKPASDRGIS